MRCKKETKLSLKKKEKKNPERKLLCEKIVFTSQSIYPRGCPAERKEEDFNFRCCPDGV